MEFVDSTTLIVGDVAQYFFDNAVIDQIQDITRTVHSPQKESEPLIKRDRPWERVPYCTVNGWTVIRDSVSGEFKCWYEDFPVDTKEVARQKVLYCVSSTCTCYARSEDGLNWEKPEFDYLDVDGRKTNIILGGKSGFHKLESITVFEDTLESDPEKRYKMLLTRYLFAKERSEEELASTLNVKPGFDTTSDEVRIEMHYSSDGIQWKPSGELPRYGQQGNGLGDAYTFFIDEDTGIYRFLTRAAGMLSVHYDERRPKTDSFFPPAYPNDESRMNKRRVFQSESKDLVHWMRPKSILTPDAMDNLDDSYYGMVQCKIGEIYVGFLNVLHEVSNTMDVRLVYSRDGWKWHQLNQRQPWLTTSADCWDKNMVNITNPPIPVDDELYVFYGGASCHHDWWITGLHENLSTPEAHDRDLAKYCIGLSKMRLDGFVSVDAHKMREGVMITQALWTSSKKLELNVVCGEGGYVDVEVTDADENVLEGFSRADCDTFKGDNVKTTITWNGKAEIPHKDCLRLRFFMRDASLYSFKFNS